MILGRNPALWLAVLAAGLNVLVIVFGVQLTAEQLAALNAFLVAFIGFVANEKDPTTLPTFALALGDRRGAAAASSSSATGSSSTAGGAGTGSASGPGAGGGSAP